MKAIASRSATRLSCWVVAAVVAASGALGAGAALAEETPQDVVQSLADAGLKILRDGALSSDEKRQRIEDIVYEKVDIETISRLVLARHWRSFSEAQRREFINQFKKHLSHTYGRNVDDYNNEDVEILGTREEARGDRTVQTKVVRHDAEDVLVDYRLRQKNGEWRVIDIVIEGVSFIANFRSQFQEVLSGGGPEKLLHMLREKNAVSAVGS